jgi:hypothetical protein
MSHQGNPSQVIAAAAVAEGGGGGGPMAMLYASNGAENVDDFGNDVGVDPHAGARYLGAKKKRRPPPTTTTTAAAVVSRPQPPPPPPSSAVSMHRRDMAARRRHYTRDGTVGSCRGHASQLVGERGNGKGQDDPVVLTAMLVLLVNVLVRVSFYTAPHLHRRDT